MAISQLPITNFLLFLQQLLEIFKSDVFFVEFHHTLQGSGQLHVNGTVNEAVNILTLLQHLLSKLLKILVGNIAHTILGKLCTGGLLGNLLQVVFLNLDTLSGDELLLDEVPA